VRENGAPYAWEPDVMLRWLGPPPDDDAKVVAAARERTRFTVDDAPAG